MDLAKFPKSNREDDRMRRVVIGVIVSITAALMLPHAAAGDLPVLPREYSSFELTPASFFDRHSSPDLRKAPFEVEQ